MSLNRRSFRQSLRHALHTAEWYTQSWAKNILAAECIDGWAGRKHNAEPSILAVYTKKSTKKSGYDFTHARKMTSFLIEHGVPNFCLLPQVWEPYFLRRNRIPLNDTQDRFWLLNDRTFLDAANMNHWLRTRHYWGVSFLPSPTECLNIFQDPQLFESMLEEDWHYIEFGGHPSGAWIKQAIAAHAQWPAYSSLLQLHHNCESREEFIAMHLTSRQTFLNPNSDLMLELPW